MTERLTSNGKQIMYANRHLADARDVAAAEAIVILINRAAWPHDIPAEERAKLVEVFGL